MLSLCKTAACRPGLFSFHTTGSQLLSSNLVRSPRHINAFRGLSSTISNEQDKSIAQTSPTPSGAQKPHLVILGCGWSGFKLIKDIDLNLYRVSVVSPTNYFNFTPLLASTAVGTLELRNISEPIRSARRVKPNQHFEFFEAEVTELNTETKTLECRYPTSLSEQPSSPSSSPLPFSLPYDLLVISVGMEVATFNIPGVQKHGLFLKNLTDARKIRQRILDCFELASLPSTPLEERERLLHFILVGAGPTGVELSGEIYDLCKQDLKKMFPEVIKHLKITIIESRDDILSAFDKTLRDYSKSTLEQEGIELLLHQQVKSVEKDCVYLNDGSKIPCGMAVWSAGIAAKKVVREGMPQLSKDKRNRLICDEHLRVMSSSDPSTPAKNPAPGVFAMGDCTVIEVKQADKNEPIPLELPATAQVAQQQGKYLARLLNKSPKLLEDKDSVLLADPFKWHNMGALAYLGSFKAIANLPGAVTGKGFGAWLLWRSAYLTKLLSIRNKILVPIDWSKAFLFGRDTTRF